MSTVLALLGWPAAVCSVALVLGPIIRAVALVLRERGCNRLLRLLAEGDWEKKPKTLAAIVQIIEQREETIRNIERPAAPSLASRALLPVKRLAMPSRRRASDDVDRAGDGGGDGIATTADRLRR